MAPRLSQHPVHLGLGATATSELLFTGMDWYGPYLERHATDGDEGRLVTMHQFSEPWAVWEMHPSGSELVVCTAGEIVLVQQFEGSEERVRLGPGEYAINPPGVWHTADVESAATALFVTSGRGTEHRSR